MRRYADELAADEPGNMRPMAVVVMGSDGPDVAMSEVIKGRDAVIEVGAGFDAGVDDRHADPVACS